MSHLPSLPTSQRDDFDDDDFSPNPRKEVSSRKTKRLLLDLVGRWHWIALGLILGYLGANYYLSKAPKLYTASASLLIKQETSAILARDQRDKVDTGSLEGMNTFAERLRRPEFLERVATRPDVRQLPGLMPPAVDWTPEWVREKFGRSGPSVPQAVEAGAQAAPPPAALAGMISGWMNISIRRFTRLLDISVTHPVPEVSKAIADAIAAECLKEVADSRTQGRNLSIGLLAKGSEEARVQLQAAGSALATYSRAVEVHKSLDAKEGEVSAMRRRYLPKHPKMVSASAELEALQKRFVQEFDTARQAPADKTYWEHAAGQLADQGDNPEDYLRIARQQLLARIGTLESEIASSTSVFNSMLTRIEESSVNQQSNESSVEISNLAQVPGGPSAPVAKKIVTTGAMTGLAGGLALAFLLLRLDNKYHTVAQLTGETGGTVLAAIADINPSHLAVAEKKHLKRHPEDASDLHEDWDERLVFRPGTSGTSYAEMFRVLRASISLLGDETKRKVTLFSSALPGEGKTSISANFALAAACQGRKTLLIDLDLRKPSVHRIFGLSREQEKGGITECLANIASFDEVVLRNTGQKNLHLILSGKRAPNPGELLDTGRLKAILARACRDYDVVVLDTAPLLAVPDTRIVAPLADNVCLVVRAEYVPKGAVRRVLDVMEEDGTPLSGIIFNGFKEKRRLMGENYSYGAYKFSKYGSAYKYGYGSYGTYGAYGSDDEEDDKPKKNRRKRRK